MKIKPLATVSLEEVIACFLIAFEDYSVKLPADVAYWRSRFVVTRADWDLSFGMFDNKKLVGYVIHGIDRHNGVFTAYNTGTGVIPAYRGNGIVDKLYDHAIPLLRERGMERCLLEVICENARAIRVYERIGFSIKRKLRTFSGSLPVNSAENELQKGHFLKVLDQDLFMADHYSWDNSAAALKLAEDKISIYLLGNEKSPEGYLVMDGEGTIRQIESKSGNFLELLTAAGTVAREVKFKNVDGNRTDLISALEKLHFSNPISQYEMEMYL